MKSALSFLSAGMALFACAAPTRAADYYLDFSDPVDTDAVSVVYRYWDSSLPPGTTQPVWSGVEVPKFHVPGTGSVYVYCLEPEVTAGSGTFDVQEAGSSPLLTESQVTALDILLTNAIPLTEEAFSVAAADPTSANLIAARGMWAAIQLAVWEIARETDFFWDIDHESANAGSYSVNTLFSSGSGPHISAPSYAADFIDSITSGAWTRTGGYSLYTAENDTLQNRLLAVAPEPGVGLLAGLGGLLTAFRRSRRVI